MKNHILNIADLALIRNIIQIAEFKTAGEIKVCVAKESCHIEGEDISVSVEKKAVHMFNELGIGNTRHSTGIIILVSPVDHRVAIYGDDAINAVFKDGWPEVVKLITENAKRDDLVVGIIEAVKKMGEELAKHFPPHDSGDCNELTDDVVFC
ncbi:MAG: TPM domain-containing protein [Candidatus Paceibacterota bacterium]